MPQFSDDLFLGTAQGYQGLDAYPNAATFTGEISTTTLTVTAMLSGDPITLGMWLGGANVGTVAYITAFGTGTGGVGTYTVSASQTAASATIVGAGNALLGDPSPMDVGVGPLGRIYVWDVVPQAAVSNNIAASQTAFAAGAVTLTAGTSVRSVVTASGVTVLQLDCPRAIRVDCATTARAFTVTGFDYYGQAMSEVITVQSAGNYVNGLKAFFQISGVTISGSATAVTVGTNDILGCPVRFTDRSYIVRVGNTDTLPGGGAGTATPAFTATATTTTGDVRGTFEPNSSSNGIRRLVMTIALPAIAVGPNATRTGAFGVNQNLVS
jgi:hypothetical protein